MINSVRLAEALSEKFGVTMSGTATNDADGQHATLQPYGIERTQSFTVDVLIGWRTVEVGFVPATFARPLLTAMAGADNEQRGLFRTFVQSAISAGASIDFQINGGKCDPLLTDSWPTVWDSLFLSFTKGPMKIDGQNPEKIETLALTWAGRMLGCVLSLMTLEPILQVEAGGAEGGARQVLIKRYERSRINRAACIEIHGAKCKVCSFDFAQCYGPVGIGFIEVHHLELLSQLEPGTILNPATDLVPLCSNCHSMAHRRQPHPYTIDELKSMIAVAQSG